MDGSFKMITPEKVRSKVEEKVLRTLSKQASVTDAEARGPDLS